MKKRRKIPTETKTTSKTEEFKAIALPYMDLVYRAAVRMSGNESDAQDLVQDSYLKAYRFFDKYEKGTNFQAWMFAILKNIFINKYRKELRTPQMLDICDIEPYEALRDEATPEDEIFNNLLDDDIASAIGELPEQFRPVVILSDLEGFSYKEVSEILDCPIGTVMSRLHRGRKLLRNSLYDYAERHGYMKS
jgi:RNA polymerase sigma-70 factor (ECF subfamily)